MNAAQIVTSFITACFIARNAYRKNSLDLSGAITAVFVGTITLYGGFVPAVILLFFFYTSSKLTKYKSAIKQKREADFKEGGRRNWEQVVANAGFSTLVFILYLTLVTDTRFYLDSRNPLKTFLLACFIGVYCCNTGDTWSSELGILSTKKPRYILAPWRVVPYGTNGGVSLFGYSAALLAGISFGIVLLLAIYIDAVYHAALTSYISQLSFVTELNKNLAIITTVKQTPVIFIAIGSAVLGSTIDSILGALFEYSGMSKELDHVVYSAGKDVEWISGTNLFNGSQINFISGVITGLLAGAASLYLF